MACSCAREAAWFCLRLELTFLMNLCQAQAFWCTCVCFHVRVVNYKQADNMDPEILKKDT